MRKELFYVAASRGRESLVVITSDKARLRETIGKSTERQSASELARKLRPGLHQGIRRGMEAARRLVEWAAHKFRTIYKNEPAIKPAINQTMNQAMKPVMKPPAMEQKMKPTAKSVMRQEFGL